MPKLKLAIIGVGLIGGSLGMCLKDRLGDEIYITGMCRTQASMDKAVELGAVDFASSNPAGGKGSRYYFPEYPCIANGAYGGEAAALY